MSAIAGTFNQLYRPSDEVLTFNQLRKARAFAEIWKGDADFDESKHPRDEAGKFSEGGGGRDSSGASNTGNRKYMVT